MFSNKVIDTDVFLDMPATTQMLYFHLAMRADDDGFVDNPKRILRMIGASDDDLRVLIGKQFLVAFDTGVIVIRHWKLHNYLRNDRYHPTIHQQELSQLTEDETGAYAKLDTTGIPDGIPNGYQMDTEVRLGKDRIDKVKHKYGVDANVLLTDEEYEKLKTLFPEDYEQRIDDLSLYLSSKGKTYKNHFATIRNWDRMDKKRDAAAPHRMTPEEEQKRAWEAFLERHKDEPDGEHYD